ncbi:putative leucine rich repeat protein [Neospora caninum Liverpool]|uniref:Putative leucine rich repeat protein n=1 Tax=Neospora caninum (strain Liverpool) TaxID=572307 RepID=F0V7K1_NEOCL|nr:putative leucine rich repeat protein [Neospora caninum Liverpool]CBZ49692.1 putative leucine rich repeat protein [Neospora caninum Liverpool]|eukprot:XP_003879727.1 putative leucine rich repeat protein [Neospora caninum Liverpool]
MASASPRSVLSPGKKQSLSHLTSPSSSAKRNSSLSARLSPLQKSDSLHGRPSASKQDEETKENSLRAAASVRSSLGKATLSTGIPSPLFKKHKGEASLEAKDVNGSFEGKHGKHTSPLRPSPSGVPTPQGASEKRHAQKTGPLSPSPLSFASPASASIATKGGLRKKEAKREQTDAARGDGEGRKVRAPKEKGDVSPKSEKSVPSAEKQTPQARSTHSPGLPLRGVPGERGDTSKTQDAQRVHLTKEGSRDPGQVRAFKAARPEKGEKERTSSNAGRHAVHGGAPPSQDKLKFQSAAPRPASKPRLAPATGSPPVRPSAEKTESTDSAAQRSVPRVALSRRPAAAVPRHPIPHLTLPRIAELAAMSVQTPQAVGEAAKTSKPAGARRGEEKKASRDKAAHADAPEASASALDMATISSLDLSEREAEDVADLACYKSLKRLDLSGNKLTGGLGFLAMNIQLRWLKAARSLLEGGDVLKQALMNLANLVVLDLSSNQITRLEAFAPLKALKTLVLSENQILLSRNRIQEVEKPPKPLTQLKKLSLSDNRLKFPALLELRLNGNSLLSVGTGVTCMSELKILDLGRNQLHRIEGVKALADHLKLNQLNILGNPLMSVASILKEVETQVVATLPNLKIFNAKPLQPRRENPRKVLWKQRQEAARNLARSGEELKAGTETLGDTSARGVKHAEPSGGVCHAKPAKKLSHAGATEETKANEKPQPPLKRAAPSLASASPKKKKL